MLTAVIPPSYSRFCERYVDVYKKYLDAYEKYLQLWGDSFSKTSNHTDFPAGRTGKSNVVQPVRPVHASFSSDVNVVLDSDEVSSVPDDKAQDGLVNEGSGIGPNTLANRAKRAAAVKRKAKRRSDAAAIGGRAIYTSSISSAKEQYWRTQADISQQHLDAQKQRQIMNQKVSDKYLEIQGLRAEELKDKKKAREGSACSKVSVNAKSSGVRSTTTKWREGVLGTSRLPPSPVHSTLSSGLKSVSADSSASQISGSSGGWSDREIITETLNRTGYGGLPVAVRSFYDDCIYVVQKSKGNQAFFVNSDGSGGSREMIRKTFERHALIAYSAMPGKASGFYRFGLDSDPVSYYEYLRVHRLIVERI